MDIIKVPPKATNFVNMTKSDKYQELYKTIESVVSGENDQIADDAYDKEWLEKIVTLL